MVVKHSMLKTKKAPDPEKKEMERDFTTLHNENFVIFSPLVRNYEDNTHKESERDGSRGITAGEEK